MSLNKPKSFFKAPTNKQPVPPKKGHKAWEDDEEPKKPVVTNKPNTNHGSNMNKKPLNNNQQNHNQNNNQKNYRYPPNPLIVQNPTYEYENKVIDDVLESSGISIKPSEGLLAEFIKKIKTLNNEIIIKLLHERFNNAQTQNDTKLLTKLLYVIDSILKEKVTVEYINLIKANVKLFEDIFNQNLGRKINQLSSDIHYNLTGKSLQGTVSQPTYESTTKTIEPQPQTNLIENNTQINEIKNSDNNITSQIKKAPETSNNNKPKFGFIKKKQNQPQESAPILTQIPQPENPIISLLDDKNISQSISTNNNVVESTHTTQEKPKGKFNFIKSKNKETPQTTTENSTQNTNLNQNVDIASQLQDVNFNTQENKQNSSGLDMNLLNQIYQSSNNNNFNTNFNMGMPNNMNFQNNGFNIPNNMYYMNNNIPNGVQNNMNNMNNINNMNNMNMQNNIALQNLYLMQIRNNMMSQNMGMQMNPNMNINMNQNNINPNMNMNPNMSINPNLNMNPNNFNPNISQHNTNNSPIGAPNPSPSNPVMMNPKTLNINQMGNPNNFNNPVGTQIPSGMDPYDALFDPKLLNEQQPVQETPIEKEVPNEPSEPQPDPFNNLLDLVRK